MDLQKTEKEYIMEAKKDFTSTAHAAYFTPNSIDS